MLGYPDSALRLNDEKDAHARQRGHPFDLGYALTIGVHEFDHRYDHKDLRRRAEECERLGRENSLPVLWAYLAPIGLGLALIREGKPTEAIGPFNAGMAFREASGGKMRSPTWYAFLAEATALTGDLDDALRLLDEQIVQSVAVAGKPDGSGPRKGSFRQFDAFASYVVEAEEEGSENFPLYKWTKAIVEDPAKRAKHIKTFAMHVSGKEVYPKAAADALEADLQPLLGWSRGCPDTTRIRRTTCRCRRKPVIGPGSVWCRRDCGLCYQE
jgi:hypothetical protein